MGLQMALLQSTMPPVIFHGLKMKVAAPMMDAQELQLMEAQTVMLWVNSMSILFSVPILSSAKELMISLSRCTTPQVIISGPRSQAVMISIRAETSLWMVTAAVTFPEDMKATVLFLDRQL